MVALPLVFLLIVPVAQAWQLSMLSTANVVHGFSSLRHNELQDMPTFLTEICPDVQIEPMLQSLSGEQFSYQSATTDDNARSDIAV